MAFTGVLLILMAVGNRISTPLRPGDADAAQTRLAQVPLRGPFQNQHIQFAEPQSEAWKRLAKAWGRPAFVITMEVARNEQGCWEDFQLEVKPAAANPVAMTPVSEPVFGHVNECAGRALGLKFQAPAADFTIAAPEHANGTPADLVILPVWPGDMRQRLGEAYLDERLAAIARWLLAAGVVLALAGGAWMWGGRAHPNERGL